MIRYHAIGQRSDTMQVRLLGTVLHACAELLLVKRELTAAWDARLFEMGGQHRAENDGGEGTGFRTIKVD